MSAIAAMRPANKERGDKSGDAMASQELRHPVGHRVPASSDGLRGRQRVRSSDSAWADRYRRSGSFRRAFSTIVIQVTPELPCGPKRNFCRPAPAVNRGDAARHSEAMGIPSRQMMVNDILE